MPQVVVCNTHVYAKNNCVLHIIQVSSIFYDFSINISVYHFDRLIMYNNVIITYRVFMMESTKSKQLLWYLLLKDQMFLGDSYGVWLAIMWNPIRFLIFWKKIQYILVIILRVPLWILEEMEKIIASFLKNYSRYQNGQPNHF